MMRPFFFAALFIFSALQLSAQQFTAPFLTPINSVYDDQQPVISRDGKQLFITIANHPQNAGGKKDAGDIWISQWQGDHWSSPVNAGPTINNKDYNAVAGISPDGQRLYLFNHYSKSDSPPTTQGIAVSTKTQSGWSAPTNISIPYFVNRSSSISGQMSSDGSVFVYSAESYNTKGAEDIYVTLKNRAGDWEESKNLGPVINSAFQEMSPSLSADTKYLYFSSNGRKGYGSFDVYFSRRLDDTWLNWSIPVNMGSRVNTDGRELFYETFPAQKLALYTSTQNSDGYGDIRSFADSIPGNLPDSVIQQVEIRRETALTAADKLTLIKGAVTNSKTGQPIVARLEFKSDSTKAVQSGNQGAYSIMIPSTKVYNIVVEAPGYIGVLEKLDIHTFEMRQVEMNFRLQPIEIGTTVNLKNVLFQVGSVTLMNESYDELNVVYDLLKTNPKIEIELAGHTDTRGDAKANLKLSQSRVDKVKAYLVSKGIAGRRIQGKGYGGKKPIASSDTEENRKLNRRVEFVILKD